MSKYVFLSYAREDKGAATAIASALEGLGYEVWWDHHLLPAENFREAIGERLDAADAVIVVWTPASVTSQWVIDEAERASQDGRLVPVILGTLPAEDLPIGLNRQHVIFLASASRASSDVFKREIVEALTVAPERRKGPSPKIAHGRANPITILLRVTALIAKAYVYSIVVVRTAMNMQTQDYNYYVLGYDGRNPLQPGEDGSDRTWLLQDEDGSGVWAITAMTAVAFVAARMIHGLNFGGRASFSFSEPGKSNLFTARALIAFSIYVVVVAAPFAAWHYFHPDRVSKVPWWWASEQLLIWLWLFPWLWLAFEAVTYLARAAKRFLINVRRGEI